MLLESRDVVVIGSGITAASVVRTLLQDDKSCSVTIPEAHTLCSGATGRNGGHLITYGGLAFSELKAAFGQNDATDIIDFAFENIALMKQLNAEFGGKLQYRDVTRFRGFEDDSSFERAKGILMEFENDNPTKAGMYQGRYEGRSRRGTHPA